MVKSMAMADPQRAKLVEATEIASAIATCEKDDNTKRMIVMSGLARVMDGFPVSRGSVALNFASRGADSPLYLDRRS